MKKKYITKIIKQRILNHYQAAKIQRKSSKIFSSKRSFAKAFVKVVTAKPVCERNVKFVSPE